jgi:hypothetical protein
MIKPGPWRAHPERATEKREKEGKKSQTLRGGVLIDVGDCQDAGVPSAGRYHCRAR